MLTWRRLFPRLVPSAYAVVRPGPYDIVHTFNAVPLVTGCPFIITFEDNVPRVWDDQCPPTFRDYLRRRLLSRHCVALLPRSEYAVREFRRANASFPKLDQIAAKVRVAYPGIAPHREGPKRPGDRLRVLFVGRDFMRKGLPVVLRAHRALRARGVPIDTT